MNDTTLKRKVINYQFTIQYGFLYHKKEKTEVAEYKKAANQLQGIIHRIQKETYKKATAKKATNKDKPVLTKYKVSLTPFITMMDNDNEQSQQ